MITFSNLRKQLTFRDIFRQTELWGLILMTCHYTDWSCLLLVETNFHFNTTNQKHYQDLGSDTSSAWEFCSSQTLFRGETSGGVQKRWPRFGFLVLLKLTKKIMWHFRFLTGTVYAVIIDILNDESARKAAFHQHFHGKFCPESLRFWDWTIFYGTSRSLFIGNTTVTTILFLFSYLFIHIFTRRRLGP